MGAAGRKPRTNSPSREIFLELERPAMPKQGKGMQRRERVLFKKSYFWIYRHTNVFLSYPYKHQEICAPFLLTHPSEFQLVLSLNSRESSAVTLHNNSAILALTGRQTEEQAVRHLLSFDLGKGQSTFNRRS